MQNIPKPRRVELTLDYDNPSDTDSLSSSPVNYHPVPMPSGSRSRTPEVTQAPSSYSEHSALLGTPPPNYGERRPSRDYHFPASSTSVRPSATPSGQQTRLRPHLNPLQHRSSVPKRSLTFKWRRRRTGNYDEDRQGLLDERAGIRVWYENYSTIDWIHDYTKERVRLRKLRSMKGFRGRLINTWDRAKAWILVTLIGIVTACIAASIDIMQQWLSGLKNGYCTTNFRWNQEFCCWGKEEREACPEWKTWSEAFDIPNGGDKAYEVSMFMYGAWGVLFSLTAAILVKISADVIATRCASPTAQPDLKVVYFAAGSGIAEVKTILGGFVIRKFLGIQTLIVKIIGSTLAVSSGLNCGKEGPFVHIACCVGNILCRIFSKFNKNEGKRREILSASAAAGVAVAFAAPIGGVLFSLEEVSYYFPIKTMIRSFFSALIAAMTLKLLNPFGNGKIAMFQVSYDRDWHWFEMAGFLLCGLFGGFFGAIFSKLNIRWQHVRKTTWLGRHPVAEVVVIMVLTVLVSYWNPFARMGLTEFVMNLFAECTSTNDNEGLCATTISAIYPRLNLLAATLVIKVILIIFTFGLRIPAGIFLPSLAVGAIFGRMVGLGMQYLTMRFPDLELFARCGSEMAAEGECVIPGVYAMVGAAASLAGVTRTTVSLVVIMFELTGALTYLLPIMLAVMVSKWTSDAMHPHGIYDLIIDLNGYPYLDQRPENINPPTISDVTESVATINVNARNTVTDLRDKLAIVEAAGYLEDGGLPILNEEDSLVGFIACHELQHALDRVSRRLMKSSLTAGTSAKKDEAEAGQRCHFKRSWGVMETEAVEADAEETDEVEVVADFSPYVDQGPITVNENANMELVMELFTKLGLCYVCVTNYAGKYIGVIHKKRLLTFLKQTE